MQATKTNEKPTVYATQDAKNMGIYWLGSYEEDRYPQAYPNSFMFEGRVFRIDKNGNWRLNNEITCWGDPFVENGKLSGMIIDSPKMRKDAEEMSDLHHEEWIEATAMVHNSGNQCLPNKQPGLSKVPKTNQKTIPCRDFAKGVDKCTKGRNCPFQHSTKNIACEYFVQGKCNQGDACKFRHSSQDIPCKYFVEGNCKHGDSCKFRHSSQDIPCKYFVSGGCKNGDGCKFRHSLKDVPCKFHAEGKCTNGTFCKFSHEKK